MRKAGKCPACVTKSRSQQDSARYDDVSRALYNSTQWKFARSAWLRTHPMCQCIQCRGVRLPARVVDHDPPHGGDVDKFWDQTTWRSMAKRCHDRYTATYDGGFGNSKRERPTWG